MAQNKEKSIKLNMILNAVKGLMGILFPLISFPYVSKILGVEGLGQYNFASSIVSYIGMVAALGIGTYAIREGARVRDSKEAFSAFASEIFTLNMISTAFSYLVLAVLLCLVPKFSDYRGTILILSLSVLVQTIGCEWVYSVYEEYAYITVRSILFQILSILMLFLFVKTEQDLNAYAVITVVSTAGANLINRIYARKYGAIRLTSKVDWKRHLKPIFMLFAMNAAVTLYVSSDITILGMMCGDHTVGIYSVSVKVYNIIKSLMSAAVVVSIPRLSALWGQGRTEEFKKVAGDIYSTLITIVMPAIVGVVLLSEQIVLLVSDASYLEAVPSLIILAVTIFFCLGAGFWSQAILIPMKKDGVVVKATIISAVVNIGLNLVLIPFWKENAAALTTLIAESVAFAMCAMEARKTLKLEGVGKTAWKTGLGCVLMGGYVLLVNTLGLGLFAHIIVAVAGAVVIYFIVELLLKNSAMKGIVARRSK